MAKGLNVLDQWAFAAAAFAALLAGISKGGFGGSLAFAGTAILALVVDPGVALALMLPVLMAIDLAAVRTYWGRWHAASARAVLTGAVPGLALGAALFSVVSDDFIRVMIGVVALGFVAFRLAGATGLIAPRPRPFDARKGWAAGAAAGFTSFVAHAGGPPFAMFMLGQDGIGKTQYHATSVIVFWLVNAAKAVLYAMLGLFTFSSLGTSALMIPFALLGTWIGVHAHARIPERAFFSVAYAALTVTAARLLWDGLA
ncbi:sulfite exporter TauE/SafE family protein [Roseibacterium sp. SDUM158017]|uniref:sulfite exporter TauE/SafE family protein n=1 Tax=Roseicyclus salinarum TaxID=3036773 RepID=UPI0024155574|nr:sulfite exporter TauE/SafE family protein [Roseibacterium sp. SDUM158017]MDG4649906.1 sulfite exporter TauE/SafE family protein [Roseibacterium sp. SDUM158017]